MEKLEITTNPHKTKRKELLKACQMIVEQTRKEDSCIDCRLLKGEKDENGADHQVGSGRTGAEAVVGGQAAGAVAEGHATQKKSENIAGGHAQADILIGYPGGGFPKIIL